MYMLKLICAGIDTGESLLEEMRKEKNGKIDSPGFLFEPLLALTGSLSLTQNDAVGGNIHKCDIPTRLHLRNELGIPEAIL